MTPRYSIAEARNHFAEIVHDLKHVSRVEVTRRGRPVAILISTEWLRVQIYRRMTPNEGQPAVRRVPG